MGEIKHKAVEQQETGRLVEGVNCKRSQVYLLPTTSRDKRREVKVRRGGGTTQLMVRTGTKGNKNLGGFELEFPSFRNFQTET